MAKIYQIRPAKASDLENLLDYINEVNTEPGIGIGSQRMIFSIEDEKTWLDQTLRDVEEKKAIYLVVEAEGKIVGSCDVRQLSGVHKHTGLLGLIIAKNYRGQGIGYELAQKVIKQAREIISELNLIILEVFADNVAAINLYKKLGFQQYGLLPKGITDSQNNLIDKILMYKEING